jgi:receptor protein-tyrosine kinase
MAQTYAQLVTEPGILQETLQRAGLSLRPELFRERVTVTAPPNTAVIRVAVEDNNPTRSAELANTLVKVFGERVQTWQEEAGVARTASSPEVASLVEQQRQYLANTLDAYASTAPLRAGAE